MCSKLDALLGGITIATVNAYDRLYLLKGITSAAGDAAAIFHQSWMQMLWNTAYDALIVNVSTLIDDRLDSHSLKALAAELKKRSNITELLPLICDLELATDRVQSPYLGIREIRCTRVAHNSIQVDRALPAPKLDELSLALSRIFDLIKRVQIVVSDEKCKIDIPQMETYATQTSKILLAGLQANLPPGVIYSQSTTQT